MRKQGFTLLEIMIVIIIIAILATVALPKYNEVVRKAKVQEPVNLLKTMASSAYARSLRTTTALTTANLLTELDTPPNALALKNFDITVNAGGTALVATGKNQLPAGLTLTQTFSPNISASIVCDYNAVAADKMLCDSF